MKRLPPLSHVKSYLPFVFLIVLELVIFLTNFTSGTYLIGWDHLNPEFAFSLNFERALSSLWQDYRGLGSLDGLSHAANLMHTLFLWLLSFILPDSLLRYLFIHLTHLLGGVGMFLLLKYLFRLKTNDTAATIASMLGALFYLLNLGIIQLYHAPLEVFAMHFAALPFLSLQLLRTITLPTRRNFLVLFLLGILTSPQAFVPTVFIVFLMLFGWLLLLTCITKRSLKTPLLIALVLLLSNAFWLLPYSYSALKTPEVIQGTKINQIASEEIFYRNKAFGDLVSVFSLKGFMLATIEYDVTARKDVYFMEKWNTHAASPFYLAAYLIILLFMLFGIAMSLRKKQLIYYPFLGAMTVSFFFLANNTPGIDQLNTFVRSTFPLIGEAFRFPFTKFMTLFAFCFSIFFGVGVVTFLRLFSDYKRPISILFTFLIFFLAYPVFQGYFTSPLLRLELPQEYLQIFSYFKAKDPSSRIALLPVHTFWNWQYRSWNYRGSDFLWYGLPQPIMERAFDPWSLENEQYFTEMSSAIDRRDSVSVKHLLKKYNLEYVLIDTTLLNTLSRQPIDYLSLETFLTQDVGMTKAASFNKLLIYQSPDPVLRIGTIPLTEVISTSETPFTGQKIGFETSTPVYTTATDPQVLPLFPSLSSEKLQENLAFRLDDKQFSFILTPDGPFTMKSGQKIFTTPTLFTTEFLIPMEIVREGEELLFYPLYPSIRVNGRTLTIPSEPLRLTPNVVKQPTSITVVDTGHTIPFTDGRAKTYLLNPASNTLKLTDGLREEILALDTSGGSTQPISVVLPDEPITAIEAEVVKVSSPFEHTDLLRNHEYTTREIPSILPSVIGERSTTIDKQDGSVTITTKNADAELAFYVQNLFHQASYVLTVTTDYTSGLPVHMYIDNPSQMRSELETNLAKNKQDNIIVIPKTEDFFSGYGIHLTVKSVGKETAQSTFKEINLYPFPQELLSRMTIQDVTTLQAAARQLTPVPYEQTSLASYRTNAPGDHLLVLSQAYDEGWRAYKVANSKWHIANGIKTAFPLLFGEEIKTHTKANNWANAWLLNNSQFSTLNSQLVIVYFPQYLQYGGQLITLLSGIILVVLAMRRRRRA